MIRRQVEYVISCDVQALIGKECVGTVGGHAFGSFTSADCAESATRHGWKCITARRWLAAGIKRLRRRGCTGREGVGKMADSNLSNQIIQELADRLAKAICADDRSAAAQEEICGLLIVLAEEIKRQAIEP